MDLNHTHGLVTVTSFTIITHYIHPNQKKVEDIGVEPMTPCVQGRCSSQLS